MLGDDRLGAAPARTAFQRRPGLLRRPPTRCCGTRAWGRTWSAAVSGPRLVTRDPDQDVLRRRLGVLDERRRSSGRRRRRPCRAARTRAHARLRAALVCTRSSYGKARLRILVQHLQVRVRRRGVEVEVVLLHVLAVIALALVSPNSRSLRIGSRPFQSAEREAQPLLLVGEAREAVLAPAVGARAGLVVGEVVPRVAVRRCSPRGRSPTGARSGRDPTSATAHRPRAPAATAPARAGEGLAPSTLPRLPRGPPAIKRRRRVRRSPCPG